MFTSSPLRPVAWETALHSIPDNAFVTFLLREIAQGFQIGCKRNLKSAYDRPEIISAYIQREVDLKRMAPLLSLPATASLQVTPFGAIPKKNKPDKWPEGYSVNDAIRRDLCSVLYTSVDKAVVLAQSLGQGCLLAKLDLKEAYRAVPVHHSDQCLLAVSWNGTTYLDRALPFGLRSAPKLTDAMMWFLHDRGVHTALHYLDDFLVMGPPGQNSCAEALTTTLAWLGIEIDNNSAFHGTNSANLLPL
jgi:hypothetical protein